MKQYMFHLKNFILKAVSIFFPWNDALGGKDKKILYDMEHNLTSGEKMLTINKNTFLWSVTFVR